MLTRSFCCFRGVSPEAERRLWQSGCLDWRGLVRAGRPFSAQTMASLAARLPEARAALRGRAADYFLSRLPVGYRLRVWPEFGDGIAFLDVETTGLDRAAEITLIGVLHAGRFQAYVRDRDLHLFLERWREIEVLITFNGARFDVPLLMKTFGMRIMPPHIDLLDEARVFGYRGGLKAIEHKLGVARDPNETGDGRQAVNWWMDFKETNSEESLGRLIRYNERDVRSLELLARKIFTSTFTNFPGPLPRFG